jgi:hypothetical protein
MHTCLESVYAVEHRVGLLAQKFGGLLDQSLNHTRVQYNYRQSGIHVSKVVMGFAW